MLPMRTFLRKPIRRDHNAEYSAGHRTGFTLIELLMVVTIIAILLAMLIPAVGSVISTARIAEVRTDIGSLEGALTQFKTKYGRFPPSSIILEESGAGWTAESISDIRAMFGVTFSFGIARDINGDGDMTDSLELTGAECLVFFLGGVQNTGFSNTSSDPFSTAAGGRTKPFYDFNISRFMDGDTDGMMEYRDSLQNQTNPFWYMSASTSGAYNLADLVPSGMTAVYSLNGDNYKKGAFQIISPGYDGQYGLGGNYDPNNTDELATTLGRAVEQDNITNFHSAQLGN